MCYQLNEHPLVSVVVPAYNAQEFIGATLQSLICQSYPHLEVIVNDDGSSDQTIHIVKKFVKKDPRIKLLQQANRGTAAARNLAIRHAEGSFIAPVDADDICYPEKIAKLLESMQQASGQVGLAYSWSAVIDHDGNLTGGVFMPEFEGNVFEDFLFANFIGNGSSCLVRKKCFDRVGLYKTNYFSQQAQGCEDYDLFLRIAEHFEFRVVKEFLTGYRKTKNSQSTNYKSMEKSCKLTLWDQKITKPWIPDTFFKWSWAYTYLWLSNISAEKRCFYDSMRYLVKAAVSDPMIMKDLNFFTIFLKRMIKIHIDKMNHLFAGAAKTDRPSSLKHQKLTFRKISIEDLKHKNQCPSKKTSFHKLKEKRRMIAKQIFKHARTKNIHF